MCTDFCVYLGEESFAPPGESASRRSCVLQDTRRVCNPRGSLGSNRKHCEWLVKSTCVSDTCTASIFRIGNGKHEASLWLYSQRRRRSNLK
jgi:hypothetical protein